MATVKWYSCVALMAHLTLLMCSAHRMAFLGGAMEPKSNRRVIASNPMVIASEPDPDHMVEPDSDHANINPHPDSLVVASEPDPDHAAIASEPLPSGIASKPNQYGADGGDEDGWGSGSDDDGNYDNNPTFGEGGYGEGYSSNDDWETPVVDYPYHCLPVSCNNPFGCQGFTLHLNGPHSETSMYVVQQGGVSQNINPRP